MSDKQREELQTKGELHHGDYHYKVDKFAQGEPATMIPGRGMGSGPSTDNLKPSCEPVRMAAGEGTMTKVPQDYTGHTEHKPQYLPKKEASPPRGHYGNQDPNSIPLTVPERNLVQKARSALKALGFRSKDR